MHRGALHAVDVTRVAAQVGEPRVAAQLVRAAVPAQHPIRAARIRMPAVVRSQQAVEITVHRGECDADDRLRGTEFLLQANDTITRRGRDDGAAQRLRRAVVGPRPFA